MKPRRLISPPKLSPSDLHPDGNRRCWGADYASTSPALSGYHDREWGRALPPGSGKLYFKQIVLQTFQAGISWAIIHKKAPAFETRFEGWDYTHVARWGPTEIAAALADAGIVRNGAKVRAAVSNAAVAARLDASTPGGFEAFLWDTCGSLPPTERLLQHGSRTEGGSWMRASTKEDFLTADGVHITSGVAGVVRALKSAGFQFMGPAVTLSFLQAAGFVNHHKPDCSMWAACEAAYESSRAAASSKTAGVKGSSAAAGGGHSDKIEPVVALAGHKRLAAKEAAKDSPDCIESLPASLSSRRKSTRTPTQTRTVPSTEPAGGKRLRK